MSLRSTLAVAFLFVLLLQPLSCKQPSENVTVVEVIDGDTIVVEGGYKVRYIGIDSPEIDEFYYLEAKKMNAELLNGREVRLEKDITDKDKYGRLLRYVYAGDTFVNAEMVRQGCAWATTYPPDIKYLVYLDSLEKEARQLKRGLWR